MSTIFKKIIDGAIPCYKIYEDEYVLAFLDVAPLSYGHTLVIPKEEAAFLHELSSESAASLGKVLPRICDAVRRVTGCEDYNVLQNNGSHAHQAVFHVHFHIIPKPKDSSGGLGIQWPATTLSAETARSLSEKIREALGGEKF